MSRVLLLARAWYYLRRFTVWYKVSVKYRVGVDIF